MSTENDVIDMEEQRHHSFLEDATRVGQDEMRLSSQSHASPLHTPTWNHPISLEQDAIEGISWPYPTPPNDATLLLSTASSPSSLSTEEKNCSVSWGGIAYSACIDS